MSLMMLGLIMKLSLKIKVCVCGFYIACSYQFFVNDVLFDLIW
jgi:hypothetical protein